ncbi:MAG: hypothetical protein K2I49_01710, partial [Ureaplasma sp.]|nr:hypothetical protein [Ureaplasma sp.]
MKNIITHDELISFFKKYNFNISEDQISNIGIDDNWFYLKNIELFKKEIEVSLKTNYKYSDYIYSPAIFNYLDINNINLRIANIIISPKTMNIDNNINNILFLNKTIDASYYYQAPSFIIFYLFIKYITIIVNKDIKSVLDNLILSNINSIEKY